MNLAIKVTQEKLSDKMRDYNMDYNMHQTLLIRILNLIYLISP